MDRQPNAEVMVARALRPRGPLRPVALALADRERRRVFLRPPVPHAAGPPRRAAPASPPAAPNRVERAGPGWTPQTRRRLERLIVAGAGSSDEIIESLAALRRARLLPRF